MKALTPKQEQFCQQYVIDLSTAKAARRAGYSAKTACSKGSWLISEPHIKARIKELQDAIAERNRLSADMVINEIRELAFYNIQDLVKTDQGIINLKRADRRLLKPVTGIKVTEHKGSKSIELKLADKLGALMNLGKHLGIFEKDNQQKTMKIKVTRT